METVLKYPLTNCVGSHPPNLSINMPMGASVVLVGLDPARIPCVWAIGSNDKTTATREIKFRIITEGDSTRGGVYIGSFTQGPTVWHVFML